MEEKDILRAGHHKTAEYINLKSKITFTSLTDIHSCVHRHTFTCRHRETFLLVPQTHIWLLALFIPFPSNGNESESKIKGPEVFIFGDPMETLWTPPYRNQRWMMLILSFVLAKLTPTFHEWNHVSVHYIVHTDRHHFLPFTHVTTSIKRRSALPLNPSCPPNLYWPTQCNRVILCLNESESFHFHPCGSQPSCKEDLDNWKMRIHVDGGIHLFLKGLGWFDFLENIAFILK